MILNHGERVLPRAINSCYSLISTILNVTNDMLKMLEE